MTSEKASAGAVTATIGFSVLALLFYAIALATLADLASSDMAGNAYAQAFGTIEVTILWLLLAVITIIAGVKGVMPVPAGLAAALLIPASGFVTIEALELLARPEVKPFLWPLVIPAAIPPLVVAFCFWSLLPKIRAAIPAGIAVPRHRAADANSPERQRPIRRRAREIRRGFRQADGRCTAVRLGAVPGYAR